MISRFSRKFALGVILLAALASAPTVHAVPGNLTDEAVIVDGQERRFLVHDFSGAGKAPLVIVLHGGGGSGENAATQTRFDTVAEREHLIAVYPYGNGRLDDQLLTWNAGHCCSWSMQQNIDDLRFISRLIDDMVSRHNVDPTRIYVTGLSNGGMMTHRVGFELGHKVAAIAPVIASVYGDEPIRETAVPTLIINGANDQIVKVDGGELGGMAGASGGADDPFKPVAEQGAYWAKVNGCNGFVSTTTAAYQKFTYACGAGKTVERYLVTGNGHAWPGGTAPRAGADQPVQTFNANEVIWDFFKRFTRAPVQAAGLKAWYYDGELNIPALQASGTLYDVKLQVTRALQPMEFALKRIEVIGTSSAIGIPSYAAGALQIPELRAGDKRYGAALNQIGPGPTQFRVDALTLLP